MTEIAFVKTCQSIQAPLRIWAMVDIPGVQMPGVQHIDVTTAPRAHASDVIFSNFLISVNLQRTTVYACDFLEQSINAYDIIAFFRKPSDHSSYLSQSGTLWHMVLHMD